MRFKILVQECFWDNKPITYQAIIRVIEKNVVTWTLPVQGDFVTSKECESAAKKEVALLKEKHCC